MGNVLSHGSRRASPRKQVAADSRVCATVVDGTFVPAPACSMRVQVSLIGSKTINTRLLMPHGFVPWSAILPGRLYQLARIDRDQCAAAVSTEFGRSLTYPVVVKPTRGMQGIGVRVGVRSDIELCESALNRTAAHGALLVEQQVFGDNYRVLIYKDRSIDVIQRANVTVTGDGTQSLRELIKGRNKQRRLAYLHGTHTVAWQAIKARHGLTGASVVPRGLRVDIAEIQNWHNGCDLVRVPRERIHPSLLKWWPQVNKLVGLPLVGIDFITPNISQPGGHVIDVNPAPDPAGHYVARPAVGGRSWLSGSVLDRQDLDRLIPCFMKTSAWCRTELGCTWPAKSQSKWMKAWLNAAPTWFIDLSTLHAARSQQFNYPCGNLSIFPLVRYRVAKKAPLRAAHAMCRHGASQYLSAAVRAWHRKATCVRTL